jgi:predicted DNA-binding protein (MmcQ/YjbR family)
VYFALLRQDFAACIAPQPPMTLDRVRTICMTFPEATEQIQWGDDLVFKVCGKMFAVARLDGAGNALAFKCAPEDFALLIENEDIVPAPYLARAHWVSLTKFDILSAAELARRLRQSYDLVVAGLPKRTQAALTGSSAAGRALKARRPPVS